MPHRMSDFIDQDLKKSTATFKVAVLCCVLKM